MAGSLAVLLLAYPVRSFVTQVGLPLWLRAAWPLVAALAWWSPARSLYVFLAGAPLLPIVPWLAAWPAVSLGECWLFALLVPAAVRVTLGLRGWRAGLPGAWAALLVLVSASLVVVLYPLQVVADGLGPFLAELHAFLAEELAVATSQAHRFASVGGWLTITDGLALLWLMLSEPGADRRRFIRHTSVAIAAGVSAVGLIGIAQWFTRWKLLPFWLQQDPNLVRVNSTFQDVNALGAFLVLAGWLPLALGTTCRGRWPRWSWRAAAAAVLAAVVFSGSRSAWAGLLAGAAVYGWGLWRGGLLQAPRWLVAHARALAAASLALLLLAGIGLTAYATLADVRHGDQRSVVTRLLYTLNLHTSWDYRLRNRTAMWEAAARMVATHPAFGIGVGRYFKEAWYYTTRREAMIRPRENAHNYYLQVAAELGLTGLAAFLALMGWGFSSARRGAMVTGSDVNRRLAVASGAGLAAFTVTLVGGHALLLREGQIAFWSVAALAGLLSRDATGSAAVTSVRRQRWRARVLVAVLVALAASVPFRARSAAARLDLTRVSSGLHGQEFDAEGRPFDWTIDRVVQHVPATARAVAFELRSLAPSPQTVTLLVDGRVADTIVLDDHDWRPLRYLVPRRRAAGRFLRLEFRVTPTWRPPGDGRELGVMMRGFRWEP